MIFPLAHYLKQVRTPCRRLGVAALGALLSLAFGGCAAHEMAANHKAFVARAPLPKIVPRENVMTAAQREAAASEGDFALLGLGNSMEPFYRAGTAVVVHPTSYHMLRRGMAVVYKNWRGGYVAHMLLHRTERGWVVMGLNNPAPDPVLVTEKNLVGIIKHAFAASEPMLPGGLGVRVAGTAPVGDRVLFLEPKR